MSSHRSASAGSANRRLRPPASRAASRAAPGAALAALLALASGVARPAQDGNGTAACRAESGPRRAALVELYTSQGCSSCPPADRWLAGLPSGEAPGEAIPLALHVAYWDYIGWKDPFAQPAFTDRQRWLAARPGNGIVSRGVYTPGVFVGGREVPDWHAPGAGPARLQATSGRPPGARITLVATPVATGRPGEDGVRVRMSWQATPPAPASAGARAAPRAFVAWKRSGYRTVVQRGENRGETLVNQHVVRAFAGPHGDALVDLTLAVPREPGLQAGTLVGFVDDGASGEVLQAVALSLAGCLGEAGSR